MRRILSALLVFVLIQLVVATPVSKPQEPGQNQLAAGSPLVNKDVVDMVKSGLTADVIVAKIKSSRCHFDCDGRLSGCALLRLLPECFEFFKTGGIERLVLFA